MDTNHGIFLILCNRYVFEDLTEKSDIKKIDMWPNLYEVLLQVLVTFAQKKIVRSV